MNKFDHDLNTFFALIFHEISLSAALLFYVEIFLVIIKNENLAF